MREIKRQRTRVGDEKLGLGGDTLAFVEGVVPLHKKVDARQATAKVLATLDDLQAKRINKEVVRIGGIIDEVDDSVISDDIRGLLYSLVVVFGNGWNWFVYER